MNRQFAPALLFAATTFVAIGAAAIVSGNAYAETPTIDTTPFVSTRTRAEVQAEVLSQPQAVLAAASEWSMQLNEPARLGSGYTRQEAVAAYRAARAEVSAFTSEDSGSSYLARQAVRANRDMTVAASAR